MKPAKLAVMVLASAAVPALAQSSLPQCAPTMVDKDQQWFTVANSAPGAVNQQCLLTVVPRGSGALGMRPGQPVQLDEGDYLITLTGGGGGGGSGVPVDGIGGGGGGAGAAPSQHRVHLEPGAYRLVIGTGGDGGNSCQSANLRAPGGDGNPTSLMAENSGITVAGFQGAEMWAGRAPKRFTYAVASGRRATPPAESDPNADNSGGKPEGSQSAGGSGITGDQSKAQDGGMLRGVALSTPGAPGKGDAGGGGGAGYGNGGDGQTQDIKLGEFGSPPYILTARPGTMGGGGGGGSSGSTICGPGAAGGHGFITIRPTT